MRDAVAHTDPDGDGYDADAHADRDVERRTRHRDHARPATGELTQATVATTASDPDGT
jgi:hypothetical protein